MGCFWGRFFVDLFLFFSKINALWAEKPPSASCHYERRQIRLELNALFRWNRQSPFQDGGHFNATLNIRMISDTNVSVHDPSSNKAVNVRIQRFVRWRSRLPLQLHLVAFTEASKSHPANLEQPSPWVPPRMETLPLAFPVGVFTTFTTHCCRRYNDD